jgi:aminoglycoside 3-N-acetyltransferase
LTDAQCAIMFCSVNVSDPWAPALLSEQLRALGVRQGSVLLVHTSFRAVGPVTSGPLGLIAALRAAIAPGGTLVMPTMTDGEGLFDPRSTPTVEMGITAELFWRQPGVLRSTHPGASFAAEGAGAPYICEPQPLAPPHGLESPVGRVHELDGQVLLIGVTHSENTTLHLAESIARVPYSVTHPCVVEVDGVARTLMIPETDHCCTGFRLADDWMRTRGLQREGQVGLAHARLCGSRDLVAVAVEQLAREPLIFLCARDTGCGACDLARASIRAVGR